MKNVGIIGYGCVGQTLAKYIYNCENLKSANLKLLWICSKHFNNKTIFPETKLYSNIKQIEHLPDFIFITSNDNQIKEYANALANIFTHKLNNKTIIHTAGAFGLELLANCNIQGAITIAAHPFQTFYSKDTSCFNNIAWGIEISDNKYLSDIIDLIKDLKGHPFIFTPEIVSNKAIYHSVAVAVSNYVTGAIKLGTLLAEQIKLPINDFLTPIIKQTIDNCFKSMIDNNNFSLTGPAIRKDTETLNKHIEALHKVPALQQCYIHFSNGLKSLLNE
jgi:predicted short-subunit dehydrogenase-like oxidoreductase (DUF2520 family)